MAETAVDGARSEAFAERMVRVLNDAALALMTSIGHQVALFDTMAGLGPATSAQIADAGGLDERYVREWLGAMTTGRIVEYDPAKHIFALPAEHAAWLTRAAGPENLAIQAQYIPLLAEVEQPLVECFRRGGGVPYSAYPRFQRLMSEDSSAVHDAALLDTIVPLVDGLGARLEEGSDVADIGCGRGHAVNLMAQAHPASRFTGFDLSQEAIAEAQVEAERMGLANARFEVRDVSELGESDAYDFITAFDAVHDQARPAEVLAGIAQALRPGGVVLMVDIAGSNDVSKNLDLPLAPFMYTVSCMHCMTVSLAMDGAGLGAMWGEETARRMLAEAGFASVEVHRIEGDILNNYYVATTPTAGPGRPGVDG